MDLRKELVERHLAGERLGELAREYGISLKTAKKFKARFMKLGQPGLLDQSRAPHWIPHKTSADVVRLLVAERKKHPTWGGRKLKEVLERRYKRAFPAASTITDVLARAGLVANRKVRRQYISTPTHLSEASAPNDVWCIDYKGQFRLATNAYCYPLTLTDQYSRFVLGVEAMSAISTEAARDVCEELFRTYGLPSAIRSDNGPPFASRGLAGLTKLSAFWLLLGVRLERIRPSHPEDNGQHERMHRTLKQETTKPPAKSLLQQQERFDAFVEEFNGERPHEALAMKRPADVYRSSARRMPTVFPEPAYESFDDVVRVGKRGYVTLAGHLVYISDALSSMYLGVNEQPDGRLLLTFVDTDLGLVDLTLNKLLPI
jgi:transposase InsO family protein